MYRPITWDEALIRALNGEDIKYIGEIEAADHPEWEEKRFVAGSLMDILRNLIFVENTDDDNAMQTRVWNLQDSVHCTLTNAVKVYSDLDQEPAPEVIPASAPEGISLKQQEPCCKNAAEDEENTDKRQQEQEEEPAAVPEDAASKQQGKTKVPRKKIDDGRILSLLNKGWTAKQIADDMEINVSTAYEHIKKIRRAL